jgi:hypothetical protein
MDGGGGGGGGANSRQRDCAIVDLHETVRRLEEKNLMLSALVEQ